MFSILDMTQDLTNKRYFFGTALFLSSNLILTVEPGSTPIVDVITAYVAGSGTQSSSVIHKSVDAAIFKRSYLVRSQSRDDISLLVIKKPGQALKDSDKAGFEFIKKYISLPIMPYHDFSLWLESEHHYDGVPATVYGMRSLREDDMPNVELVSWTLYSESRCQELIDEDVYDERPRIIKMVKGWISDDKPCLMREIEWEIPEVLMQAWESNGLDIGDSIRRLLQPFASSALSGKSGGPVIAKTTRNELVGSITSSITLKLEYGEETGVVNMLSNDAIMRTDGACGDETLVSPVQAYINHLAEQTDCKKRRKKVRFRLFGFFAPIDELRKMLLDPYVVGYLDQVAPHHADLRKALFGADSTH